MAKKCYVRPSIKNYGEVGKLTQWGMIEEATGLSSGQILDKVPAEYRDDARRWVDWAEKTHGDTFR